MYIYVCMHARTYTYGRVPSIWAKEIAQYSHPDNVGGHRHEHWSRHRHAHAVMRTCMHAMQHVIYARIRHLICV